MRRREGWVVIKANDEEEAHRKDLEWYRSMTPGDRLEAMRELRRRAAGDAPDVRETGEVRVRRQ